jgi:DNA replication protein DnaC
MRRSPSAVSPAAVYRDAQAIRGDVADTLRLLRTGSQPWPLFMHGPAGTGKTCAAMAFLDWIAGDRCYYVLPTLLTDLIDAGHRLLFDGRGEPVSPRMLWCAWRSAAIACLDEIGCRDKASDFHYETLKECIDHRRGPAIYISNLPPAAIAAIYDDRIASRLCAGTVLHVGGKDRRLP